MGEKFYGKESTIEAHHALQNRIEGSPGNQLRYPLSFKGRLGGGRLGFRNGVVELTCHFFGLWSRCEIWKVGIWRQHFSTALPNSEPPPKNTREGDENLIPHPEKKLQSTLTITYVGYSKRKHDNTEVPVTNNRHPNEGGDGASIYYVQLDYREMHLCFVPCFEKSSRDSGERLQGLLQGMFIDFRGWWWWWSNMGKGF